MEQPNTTLPSTATDPKASAPTAVKIVEADGTVFSIDLNHMSAEQSVALHDALGKVKAPTNYTQVADHMARIALSMQSIVSVNLPPGMNYQQAVNQLMEALTKGGGRLLEGSPAWMNQMIGTSFGQQVLETNVWKSVEGAAAVSSATGDFVKGFGRPYSALVKAVKAVGGTTDELGKAVDPGISEAQAKAFGAAYAAALYMQVDAPDSPAATRRRDPNLLDKGTAWVQSTTDAAWRWLPAEWAGIFTAIGKWVGSGFKKDWNSCYNEAKAEHEAYRATPQKTYDEILRKNVETAVDKAVRPQAAEMIAKTDDIAGHDFKPMAEITAKGGLLRGTDGLHYDLSFVNGQPKLEAIKGADGKPLTMVDREVDRWKNVAEAATPKTTADWAGAALGTYVGVKYFAPPLLKTAVGTVRAGAGAVAGVASAYNDSVAATVGGVNSFKAAKTAAELQKLQDEQKVVQDKLEKAREAAAKLNRPTEIEKEIKKAEAEVEKLRQAGDKTDALVEAETRLNVLKTESDALKEAAKRMTAGETASVDKARAAANKLVGELVAEEAKIDKALKGSNGVLRIGKKTGAIDAATAAEKAAVKSGSSAARVAVAQKVSAHGEQASGFFRNVLQKIGVGNGASFAEQAPGMFKFFKGAAEKIPFITPFVAATQTVANVSEKDNAGTVLRGAEAAGLWWGVKELGSKFFAPAGVIMEGADFTHSTMRHDNRGMVTSGTALGTMAAGAGAGFVIGGLAGGGFFSWATAPAGALVGLTWGGLASIGTSLAAGYVYDKNVPTSAQAQPKTHVETDLGIAAAIEQTRERAMGLAKGADAQAASGTINRAQTAAAVMPVGGLQRASSPVLLLN